MTPAWRRLFAPACALLTFAIAAGASADVEQGGGGRIGGLVRLTAARSAPLSTSPYGRRGVPPKAGAASPEINNVVVYLAAARPAAPPSPVRARIAQRSEQFVPPVTTVTVGSTVEFPNEDPFFHNVFSLSRAATFDLGRYPSGESRESRLMRPGIVKVFCKIHAQMSALIMVLDHPWFTTPSSDGSFMLPPVPAGEHTVVAWHERIGERRERVRVAPGASVTVSFTLPVLEQP